MDSWLLLRSGTCNPAFNMALDEALLEAMSRLQRPLLRFYGWTEPAATFGYFQKIADIERMTALRPLVRRPTAGGLVPHDADWTYSVAIPTTHEWYAVTAVESYRRIHEWLRRAFEGMGIETKLAPNRVESQGQCFIGYERFDLLCRGRKIAGAAQRRNTMGLLIQGSVQPPDRNLRRDLWEESMCQVSPYDARLSWTALPDADPVFGRAEELSAAKYSLASYNRRR